MIAKEICLSDFGSSEALVAGFCKATPNACACAQCVAMCHRNPCLGTPQDIERLMAAGQGHRLRPTLWLVGVAFGMPAVKMVQIASGPCAMLRDGLCSLHDAGLKPTEGRLANCQARTGFLDSAVTAVALTWLMPANRALVERLIAWAHEPSNERTVA